MKTITKAIIPAAGLGTRMLPIARSVPKEMLPIVDRPAISYLVEEAKKSGVTDLLIITSRGKGAMEDYFDYSPEYEERLFSKGKSETVKTLRESCEGINVYFIRQHEAKGLGHAVLCARDFVGEEPFYVLYGDDIVRSETPVCRQLYSAYEKYGLAVAGVKSVSLEQIYKYCSLDAKLYDGAVNEYFVRTMIEKPAPEQVYTNLAILGRVLLTPEIFDILDKTPMGAGGELQLTDAMKTLAEAKGMTAVEFEGTRYDMGSKLGFITANIEYGIDHPELGEDFREYLKGFAKSL